MAKNENRCWPGCEAVKGKEANEQRSCKKKAESKSTATDKKAQNNRSKQIDRWEKAHPGSGRKSAQGHGSPFWHDEKDVTL